MEHDIESYKSSGNTVNVVSAILGIAVFCSWNDVTFLTTKTRVKQIIKRVALLKNCDYSLIWTKWSFVLVWLPVYNAYSDKTSLGQVFFRNYLQWSDLYFYYSSKMDL